MTKGTSKLGLDTTYLPPSSAPSTPFSLIIAIYHLEAIAISRRWYLARRRQDVSLRLPSNICFQIERTANIGPQQSAHPYLESGIRSRFSYLDSTLSRSYHGDRTTQFLSTPVIFHSQTSTLTPLGPVMVRSTS